MKPRAGKSPKPVWTSQLQNSHIYLLERHRGRQRKVGNQSTRGMATPQSPLLRSPLWILGTHTHVLSMFSSHWAWDSNRTANHVGSSTSNLHVTCWSSGSCLCH